jgi:hypothetical protein
MVTGSPLVNRRSRCLQSREVQLVVSFWSLRVSSAHSIFCAAAFALWRTTKGTTPESTFARKTCHRRTTRLSSKGIGPPEARGAEYLLYRAHRHIGTHRGRCLELSLLRQVVSSTSWPARRLACSGNRCSSIATFARAARHVPRRGCCRCRRECGYEYTCIEGALAFRHAESLAKSLHRAFRQMLRPDFPPPRSDAWNISSSS